MPPLRQLTARILLPLPADRLHALSWDELWRLHDGARDTVAGEQWPVIGASGYSQVTARERGTDHRPPATDKQPANLLQLKAHLAREALRDCHLCERHCGIDRLKGETAYCGVAETSYVGSEFIHMGEEAELIPSYAVFLAGCTFHCVYCQAHKVAFNPRAGFAPTLDEWLALISERQRQGARNVNFVGGTPEPHVATILQVAAALPPEVDLPFVMNANMSMTPLAMKLMDGVIDLYLADFRHGNDDCARRLMAVDGYLGFITRNLLQAAATADLLVRVLVLPNHLDCCLRPILEWLAAHLPAVRLNVMFQYRPSFKSWQVPDLARRLTDEERVIALRWCDELGLKNQGRSEKVEGRTAV